MHAPRDVVDVNFCDFGQSRYRLYTPEGPTGGSTGGALRLSLHLPSFAVLAPLGLLDYLIGDLGGSSRVALVKGGDAAFDFTIEFDRSLLADRTWLLPASQEAQDSCCLFRGLYRQACPDPPDVPEPPPEDGH